MENKFQRKLTFCSQYKENITTLMGNRYAKKNYLTLPQKENAGISPIKKRSLNNELMSSSDLTSQMIWVLMKFRKEPIAMFYQLHVPAKHKFLRLLCWESNNFNVGKITILTMNVQSIKCLSLLWGYVFTKLLQFCIEANINW